MRHALVILLSCAVTLPIVPIASGSTLFGLLNTGELYSSDTDGTSWSVLSALPVSDAVGLAAGDASTELFLVSETGTFYHSNDAGSNWSAMGAVTASDVAVLVPFKDRILVLTTSGTTYKTTDDGVSFTAVGAITASDVVAAVPFQAMTFAVTRTGTVYRSDDAGVTWFAVGAIPTSSAVAIAELDELNLFVLTDEGLVALSKDLGATWAFVGTTNQVGMTTLTTVDGVLFASTREGHVAMSDNAVDWTWEGSMNQLTVRALAHDTPTQTGVSEQRPSPVLRMLPPWPNPARGSTNIAFELDREAEVTVQVFDLQGRLVDVPLLRISLPEGITRLDWQPPSARAGIYYVKAQLGDEVQTRKIVWLER